MAGYVEVYTVSSWGEPSATWISDAGFSRNFGANLQIDIEAGRRISSGSACWFVATDLRYGESCRSSVRATEQIHPEPDNQLPLLCGAPIARSPDGECGVPVFSAIPVADKLKLRAKGSRGTN
ncbi:MAG: hypothetical protein WDO73_13285 [Ignavibacteriota bacterium]